MTYILPSAPYDIVKPEMVGWADVGHTRYPEDMLDNLIPIDGAPSKFSVSFGAWE